ncbi:hypothetical protein [Nocardioides sp. LML1-1-1.1]|uniref:hypothetical protein n=1 Tax=Nocardioides sp. LML1-1-1.1 TaxID=3135248 RepID=UPI00344780D2
MPDTKQPRRATRAQVRQFLEAAGYEGTPPDDLVTEYVDLVGAAGRPGLPRHRLAVHLTAQSPGWTAPALEAFEDAWRQQQQARARAASAARETAARDAERAASYVAGVWQRTGTGPTWTELGDEMGWSPALRARIIRLLAHEGVLTYSTAPRSLAAAESGVES